MTSCLLHQTPSEKVYCKRKEFVPKEIRFFPFRLDPFSEESQNKFDKITPFASVFTSLVSFTV